MMPGLNKNIMFFFTDNQEIPNDVKKTAKRYDDAIN